MGRVVVDQGPAGDCRTSPVRQHEYWTRLYLKSNIRLDTNAYVAFKRGTLDIVEVLTHVPRIGINSIVLSELLSGFAIETCAEANRQELQRFLTSERVH